MSVRMNPAQFAAHCRKAAARVTVNVIAAESVTLQEADKAALLLSSGPHSTAQLRAAGHPYSRRAPDPSYDAAVINVQSGEFKDAWESAGPTVTGAGVVSKLSNGSKVAGLLDKGTSKMIARPVAEAIVERVQPGRAERLNEAVRSALKP